MIYSRQRKQFLSSWDDNVIKFFFRVQSESDVLIVTGGLFQCFAAMPEEGCSMYFEVGLGRTSHDDCSHCFARSNNIQGI